MKAERGMRLVVICTCVSVCSSSSIFVVLNGFGCCFDSLYRNQVAHHVRRCRRLLFSQVHKCQQISTKQNFKVNARCIPLKYSCVELALASPPLPSCLVLQFPLTPKHLSTRQGLKLARWKGAIVFNTEQSTYPFGSAIIFVAVGFATFEPVYADLRIWRTLPLSRVNAASSWRILHWRGEVVS